MKLTIQLPRIKKTVKRITLPIVIFILFEVIFIGAFVYSRQVSQDLSQQRFSNDFFSESQSLGFTVERYLSEYTSLLHAARAFYNSSEKVERDEWSTFVKSLNTSNNYPAISNLVFVRRVDDNKVTEFENQVRIDTSLIPEGYPDFNVKSLSEEDVHYFIDFSEPFNATGSGFGYDYSSETARKQSVEKARDTNNMVITAPISLLNDQTGNKSFLMMMPIYESDEDISTLQTRREHFIGVVQAVVRAEDFFSEVISSTSLNNIGGLRVTDLTDREVFLLPFMDKSGSITARDDYFELEQIQSERINIGTRTWKLNFVSGEQLTLTTLEEYSPWILLVMGSFISILFSLVLYNSQRLQIRAEEIAHTLTQDLQKFQLAVENVSDHIVITDSEGVVIYANPAAEQITGFSQKEILGKKAGKLWGGLMDKAFYQRFWQTIKDEKRSFSGDVTNKRKNGELYDANITVVPVLNDSNEILFYVGVERDITAAKQIERIKDEFVSVASHELRTPLTAIDGLVSMILEGDYGKVSKKLLVPLEDVKTSSTRLIDLVNDLLSVSRIEAGRLTYELIEFDIKKLIDTEIDLLSIVAEQKGINLIAEDVASVTVQADQAKVSQILNNLVGNALKFTQEGTVTVSTRQTDDLLYISIEDTGVGIKESDTSKLFSKFQQLDTGKMRQAGTGLGLYISKKMCEDMGGSLALVKSVVDKGSTFAFSIPVANSENAHNIKTRLASKSEG